MVSIIMLTCNNLKYTKLALQSLEASTNNKDTPFEVIIVDNNSTDGTLDYINELQKAVVIGRPGAGLEIHIISNDHNAGFPVANNQGATMARGEFLCLVNNDIVFSKGWLGKLLRVINSDPSIAAVGPYTSHSSGYQQVIQKVPYKDQASLNILAQKAELQDKEVDFLVFFCTLIKKRVWDEIGGLDEDFGRGNYEDNLFCYRAIEKGYKLKVVNAYVHHFGSKTFNDKGKEKAFLSLLAENQKVYHKKIGKYKTISLCMIVGDQEKPDILYRALSSVAEWVDEINIVFNYKRFRKGTIRDNEGQYPKKFKKVIEEYKNKRIDIYGKFTPKEIEEARLKMLSLESPTAVTLSGYGNLKYSFITEINYKYLKWTNFSGMRNKSLDMARDDYGSIARTDYILWMDTDDILATPQSIRDLVAHYPDCDAIKCRVLSATPQHSDEILHQNRMFKNKREYRFRNLVHEDISISMREAKAKVLATDITFRHLGNIKPGDTEKKNARNYKFLAAEIASPQAHVLTYYHMVNCLMMRNKKGDALQALRYIKDSFEKFNLKEEDPLYSKLFVLKGLCCMKCNQVMAAKQSFHHVFDKFKNPEAAINLAAIYRNEARWERIILILEEVLESKGVKLTNMPIDIREIAKLAHAKLGDAYAHKENMEKAEEHYSMALLANERDIVVADRLMQLIRKRGDDDKAMYMTMKYVNMYPTYWVGWSNMGQYELRAGRHVTAKTFFEEALRINPKCKEAIINIKGINLMLRGERR